MEEPPINSQPPQQVEGVILPPATAQPPSPSTVQQVIGKSTATTTPTKKPKKNYFKAWAWRLTAIYFWVHAAITVAAGYDAMAGTRSVITAKTVMLLSRLHFAPVNAGHLPGVAVMVWLLFITAFSPVQLLLGFPLYIAGFPIGVTFRLVFRKTLKVAEANQVATAAPATSKESFPVISCSGAMLAAWFLLYGGSSSWGPNFLGFTLSGALFLSLAYEALDRTSPVETQDLAIFSRIANWGTQALMNALNKAKDINKPITKVEISSGLRVNGFLMRPIRRLTVCLFSHKGRERVAKLILVEYIVSLVLVGLSAVLFWAFAIKIAVPSEQMIPLTKALRMSASHFLPGVSGAAPEWLPWWTEFGPAVTAWILFVVYIGPVGSALPVQQEAFFKHIAPARQNFTNVGKLWHLYRRLLKAREKQIDAQ
jgi:hypothetical protein